MIYKRNIINVLDRTLTKMPVNVNIASWLNKLLYISEKKLLDFLNSLALFPLKTHFNVIKNIFHLNYFLKTLSLYLVYNRLLNN